MADYQKGIQNGTMMIRDTGGWVEFWFITGSSTYNNQQTWGYQANGAYNQGDFRLARGGAWQRFGSVFVDTEQDVMFRIIGEGLGWPTTDFSVRIPRGTIPAPPVTPHIWSVGSTTVDVGWGGDGGPGGLSITGREIWYSWDSTARGLVSPDGSRRTQSGLSPGTYYNFWARNANAKGMSGFSAPVTIRTLRVPDAPQPVFFYTTEQTSTSAAFSGNWDGGTPVREWQMGWGTDPTYPTSFLSHYVADVRGLLPGRRYYFWARGRNDVGWGPWSPRSEVLLNAGAWVKQGTTWVRAIPWVKFDGVWKVARPYTLTNGTWKVTKS